MEDKKVETWNKRIKESKDSTKLVKKEIINNVDSVKLPLKESFKEEDIIANEYLQDELKPIRENFKKINSKENWTKIDSIELWETTEGGLAKYYYDKNMLEKIIERHFGETFQIITEYYLLNGELSFIFEKSYKYNRPIYWDSLKMIEYNDTESFDFDSSEIQEDRSYFKNGKLLHKLESGDCGSPFAEDYLIQEQKRLSERFETIKNKAHKHNNN